MFDIGSSELLMIAIVAVIVIGPKDLPRALYKLGQIMNKARTVSRHFRAGIDTMIREAEMEELERKWAEQNRRIMAEHPDGSPVDADAVPAQAIADQSAASQDAPDAGAENAPHEGRGAAA